jgi:hypothetical protein
MLKERCIFSIVCLFLLLGQFTSFFKDNKFKLQVLYKITANHVFFGYVQIIRDPGCPKTTVLPGTLLVADTEANELRFTPTPFSGNMELLETDCSAFLRSRKQNLKQELQAAFFYLNADPDPGCQTNADPCGFMRIRIRILVRL